MEGKSCARVQINLKEGIVELEGTEEFVSNQLEWLRELIINTPETLKISEEQSIATVPNDMEIKVINNDSNIISSEDKYLKVFGVEKEKVDMVIHTDINDFKIISKKVKGSNADKQIAYSLMYCLAKEFYGQTEASFSELRELCTEYGCLDDANFASIFKRNNDTFIIIGKPKSKSKSLKLTFPGRKKAQELIASLVG